MRVLTSGGIFPSEFHRLVSVLAFENGNVLWMSFDEAVLSYRAYAFGVFVNVFVEIKGLPTSPSRKHASLTMSPLVFGRAGARGRHECHCDRTTGNAEIPI